VLASLFGVSAAHPTKIDPSTGTNEVIMATSLLSSENIARLWVEMPKTFTHFHPLGYVLVVMLGAGVAERSGLFDTAMRAGVRDVPRALLTPAVVLVGMLGNLAADAAYVVLIPLAGIIFHAAGRHPIAGIAAAFAGVSGGFSANLVPGQLDALLFGITEASVETVFGDFTANIAGNWFFIAAMTFVFLPVIWFVTDAIIEPRLGAFDSRDSSSGGAEINSDVPLTAEEKKGLRFAGLALLFVVGLWILFTVGPGTPLIDESASAEAQMSPFYRSLVGAFFLLFLLAGWAYGKGAGTIDNHRAMPHAPQCLGCSTQTEDQKPRLN
jgi:aminobenzoyl-glutamate transport protein